MSNQFYRPENRPGFQYEKQYNSVGNFNNTKGQDYNDRRRDEDLIIEDNTIYEIDRECFERLKKSKRKR